MSARFARVAFNVRGQGLFDYHLPPGAAKDIVGRRVLAPLGRRRAVGIVMETAARSGIAAEKIKTLEHIYQDMPPLPPAILQLCRFCADYYHHPIGIAVFAALPAFFRRANTYTPPAGYRLATGSPAPPLAGSAAAVHALLQQGATTVADIRQTVANPYHALKKLQQLGLIERCHVWDAPAAGAPAAAPAASRQQQQALDALQLDSGFAPHLLFGATGSGKSEVYLRAAARVLQQGRQVLLLTPEIHLTPQLESHLRRRFPAQRIAVLHSSLADGERTRNWLMARAGEAGIVLGTRLAVFAPMPALGLIVVDEEHDDSFKQEEGGLIFSARNAAVWRAKNEGIPFIAGSATPALESMHNAQQGGWRLLPMTRRVSGAPPRLEIISEGGNLYHGMESEFVRQLSGELAEGRQCLVFINRRGYAPTLLCRQCSRKHACHRCSSGMTVHRRRHVLCCHLCGHTVPLPAACAHCGGPVAPLGSGTQRIEEALKRLFPDARALRIDRDAASGGSPFAAAREDIESGRIQLLIGTQLIAKGHNLPALSLIGILNADAALAASDLRAEERLFALLSQVSGRGTRNPRGCRVLVQTALPEHPFYRELQHDDVNSCWQRLLAMRRQSGMPPFAHLALLRGRDKNPARLKKSAGQIVAAARAQAHGGGVQVFDAVAPPVEKVSGWHRLQILLYARRRRPLQDFLRRFVPQLPAGGGWLVDVDPLSV